MKLETSPFLVKRMDQKRQQQLRDVGSKLENPPATKDALVKLLKVHIFGFFSICCYYCYCFFMFACRESNERTKEDMVFACCFSVVLVPEAESANLMLGILVSFVLLFFFFVWVELSVGEFDGLVPESVVLIGV